MMARKRLPSDYCSVHLIGRGGQDLGHGRSSEPGFSSRNMDHAQRESVPNAKDGPATGVFGQLSTFEYHKTIRHTRALLKRKDF